MNNKIIQLPNALSIEHFKRLQELIMGLNFPWYYNTNVVDDMHILPDTEKYQFQFTHVFQESNRIVTNESNWEALIPVFALLDPITFIRVKANLVTRQDKLVTHGYHVDTITPCCVTAILYINTNDGYTEFEDGTKIPSVENSMVIFPSYMMHSGSTCTDVKSRMAININFIPVPDSAYAHLTIPESVAEKTRPWGQKKTGY